MKYSKSVILTFVALFAMAGCKSQFEALLNSTDVDYKYEEAFNLYNIGKYNKAAQVFESLTVQTTGTARDDTVQYYWGLSNYRFQDYYTAEANFSKFVESFPRSPFSTEARFLRIDCLYLSTYRYELDQAPSYRAISAIQQYISETPNSPHLSECYDMLADLQTRIDTKAYENARLYYKMEDYLASRVAFRNVLKANSENLFREDILYYIAMSSYRYAKGSVLSKQRERYLTFVDDYFDFIGEFPSSHYRREVDVMYKRSQKELGREAVLDAEINQKEKEFEKERKAFEKALKQEQKKKQAEEKKAKK